MQMEYLEDLQLQERIQILEKEQVELVNIPVTEFDNGDPADIVNDFQRVSVCVGRNVPASEPVSNQD